jgi:hypothetical protein
VALGWGLWEGPARFIFGAEFFARRPSLLPTVSGSHPLDFLKKWPKMRYDDELEVNRFRIKKTGPLVGGRFATVRFTERTLWHF